MLYAMYCLFIGLAVQIAISIVLAFFFALLALFG
tara:strand:+ start:1091 stop:1192 length:102 start_codon:yes stop_codon:yes gene_type:complete